MDQTFAKEGLAGAFRASGAIVAFAASVQAFAQVAPSVGLCATWTCVGLFCLAPFLLGVGCVKFTGLLRGWAVKDLSGAEEFLKDLGATKQEADLKLIAECHVGLVKARLKKLFAAMRW